MTGPWDEWLARSAADLRSRNLLRRLRPLDPRDGLHARAGDREVVLFSSNDYLGLSSHEAVRSAAADAARESGLGPRGAALVCGYTVAHESLERELAGLKGTEAALLCPTGYAANLAVLSSLASPGTAVFSDERNHASIIDGCRLARAAGASVHVYRHADPGDLARRLGGCDAGRKLIVTDTVFSMDGDHAPLEDLVALRREYGALLAVDEAHALLVHGDRGGGLAEACGVGDEVDVQVGTLGKAIGAQGGFVGTSDRLREHLLNRGRSFIYSTALPVPVVAAARAALTVFREEPDRRARLESHVETLARALGVPPLGPILGVVLGDEAAAVELADRLLERGFYVPAIRPPTVPPGTSRLRITVSAGHTKEEVEALAGAIDGMVDPRRAPPAL